MARGILTALRTLTGADIPGLTADVARPASTLDVLDTQVAFSWPPHAAYQVPNALAAHPWVRVHTSQYKPQIAWGASLGGSTTNQNLESMTFPDGSFDIVVTSDVMEHVRLYKKAHREIHRVLRPGGFYLFTVPHTRATDDHLVRVAIRDDDDPAQDEHLLPPEYHGSADPDEQGGVLSYRVFGRAIDAELTDLGFDVSYLNEPDPSLGIFASEVFVCRRREATPGAAAPAGDSWFAG